MSEANASEPAEHAHRGFDPQRIGGRYSRRVAPERGTSRRNFLSSGIAKGGTVLGVPTAVGAEGQSTESRIKALRDDVAANDTSEERVRLSMLSKLDRAGEAATAGDDDLVCALLKRFIKVADSTAPTDGDASTASEERVYEQEARSIREQLGCV